MCVCYPLFGAGTFVSAVVKSFGPENDFPYWKPFLLAGTKREPIKQSLWEKTIAYMRNSKVSRRIVSTGSRLVGSVRFNWSLCSAVGPVSLGWFGSVRSPVPKVGNLISLAGGPKRRETYTKNPQWTGRKKWISH